MPTMPVKGNDNAEYQVQLPLPPGTAAASASDPVTLSTEDKAALAAISNPSANAATALGALADGESTTGNGSVIALLKNLRTRIAATVTGIGAPADAEATADGSLIGVLKRARSLLGNLWVSIGQTTDAASTGNGSVIALLKQMRTHLSDISTATTPNTNIASWGGAAVDPLTSDPVLTQSAAEGTAADAAYSGSGSSSVVAALKGIYGLLAGYLTTRGYGFEVVDAPATTNGAYSAGDVIGGLRTVTLGRANDEAFLLNEVQVTFKSAVTPAIRLVLFNAAPTGIADNALYSTLAAADITKVRRTLSSAVLGASYETHGGGRTITLTPASPLIAKPIAGARTLAYFLVAEDAVTLGSTADVQVRFSGTGV